MKFATIRPGMLFLLFTSCFAQSDYHATVTFSPTPEHPVCNEYYLEHDSSLTFKQRACLYKSTVITPSAVFGAAFFAGIDQARDTPAEWRQGFVGYSRRFGSNLGQSVAKTTGEFLASAALGEDPRLRPISSEDLPTSKGLKRFSKAVSAPLVIWGSHVRPRGGYLAGSLASGFVGMAYYPQSQLKVSQAFIRSGTAFGGYVANSIFVEYQGDIMRYLGRLLGSSSKPK